MFKKILPAREGAHLKNSSLAAFVVRASHV